MSYSRIKSYGLPPMVPLMSSPMSSPMASPMVSPIAPPMAPYMAPTMMAPTMAPAMASYLAPTMTPMAPYMAPTMTYSMAPSTAPYMAPPTMTPTMMAPLIDDAPFQKPLTMKLNEPASVTIVVAGHPRPSVRWQIGRKRVKESAKYRMEMDVERCRHTLVMSRVTEDIEKGIWVVATNTYGEDCCLIQVKIYELLTKKRFSAINETSTAIKQYRRTGSLPRERNDNSSWNNNYSDVVPRQDICSSIASFQDWKQEMEIRNRMSSVDDLVFKSDRSSLTGLGYSLSFSLNDESESTFDRQRRRRHHHHEGRIRTTRSLRDPPRRRFSKDIVFSEWEPRQAFVASTAATPKKIFEKDLIRTDDNEVRETVVHQQTEHQQQPIRNSKKKKNKKEGTKRSKSAFDDVTRRIFGEERSESWERISPSSHDSNRTPPMLFVAQLESADSSSVSSKREEIRQKRSNSKDIWKLSGERLNTLCERLLVRSSEELEKMERDCDDDRGKILTTGPRQYDQFHHQQQQQQQQEQQQQQQHKQQQQQQKLKTTRSDEKKVMKCNRDVNKESSKHEKSLQKKWKDRTATTTTTTTESTAIMGIVDENKENIVLVANDLDSNGAMKRIKTKTKSLRDPASITAADEHVTKTNFNNINEAAAEILDMERNCEDENDFVPSSTEPEPIVNKKLESFPKNTIKPKKVARAATVAVEINEKNIRKSKKETLNSSLPNDDRQLQGLRVPYKSIADSQPLSTFNETIIVDIDMKRNGSRKKKKKSKTKSVFIDSKAFLSSNENPNDDGEMKSNDKEKKMTTVFICKEESLLGLTDNDAKKKTKKKKTKKGSIDSNAGLRIGNDRNHEVVMKQNEDFKCVANLKTEKAAIKQLNENVDGSKKVRKNKTFRCKAEEGEEKVSDKDYKPIEDGRNDLRRNEVEMIAVDREGNEFSKGGTSMSILEEKQRKGKKTRSKSLIPSSTKHVVDASDIASDSDVKKKSAKAVVSGDEIMEHSQLRNKELKFSTRNVKSEEKRNKTISTKSEVLDIDQNNAENEINEIHPKKNIDVVIIIDQDESKKNKIKKIRSKSLVQSKTAILPTPSDEAKENVDLDDRLKVNSNKDVETMKENAGNSEKNVTKEEDKMKTKKRIKCKEKTLLSPDVIFQQTNNDISKVNQEEQKRQENNDDLIVKEQLGCEDLKNNAQRRSGKRILGSITAKTFVEFVEDENNVKFEEEKQDLEIAIDEHQSSTQKISKKKVKKRSKSLPLKASEKLFPIRSELDSIDAYAVEILNPRNDDDDDDEKKVVLESDEWSRKDEAKDEERRTKNKKKKNKITAQLPDSNGVDVENHLDGEIEMADQRSEVTGQELKMVDQELKVICSMKLGQKEKRRAFAKKSPRRKTLKNDEIPGSGCKSGYDTALERNEPSSLSLRKEVDILIEKTELDQSVQNNSETRKTKKSKIPIEKKKLETDYQEQNLENSFQTSNNIENQEIGNERTSSVSNNFIPQQKVSTVKKAIDELRKNPNLTMTTSKEHFQRTEKEKPTQVVKSPVIEAEKEKPTQVAKSPVIEAEKEKPSLVVKSREDVLKQKSNQTEDHLQVKFENFQKDSTGSSSATDAIVTHSDAESSSAAAGKSNKETRTKRKNEKILLLPTAVTEIPTTGDSDKLKSREAEQKKRVDFNLPLHSADDTAGSTTLPSFNVSTSLKTDHISFIDSESSKDVTLEEDDDTVKDASFESEQRSTIDVNSNKTVKQLRSFFESNQDSGSIDSKLFDQIMSIISQAENNASLSKTTNNVPTFSVTTKPGLKLSLSGSIKSVSTTVSGTAAKPASTIPTSSETAAEPASTISKFSGRAAKPASITPTFSGTAAKLPASITPTFSGTAAKPASITPTFSGTAAKPASIIPTFSGTAAKPASTIPTFSGTAEKSVSIKPTVSGTAAKPASTIPTFLGTAVKPVSTIPTFSETAAKPVSTHSQTLNSLPIFLSRTTKPSSLSPEITIPISKQFTATATTQQQSTSTSSTKNEASSKTVNVVTKKQEKKINDRNDEDKVEITMKKNDKIMINDINDNIIVTPEKLLTYQSTCNGAPSVDKNLKPYCADVLFPHLTPDPSSENNSTTSSDEAVGHRKSSTDDGFVSSAVTLEYGEMITWKEC